MAKRGFLLAGLLAVSALTPAQGASLFVFGDSLVDAGNVALFLNSQGQPSRTPAALGYFQNRFSNNFTYADRVSQGLFGTVTTPYGVPAGPPQPPRAADPGGDPLQPARPALPPVPAGFNPGGDNFAWGGATGSDDPTDLIPSFADQIEYFTGSGKMFAADDVVLVTFGGNDIQDAVRAWAGPATPNADFSATELVLEAGLQALIDAGARSLIVTGQADIGRIPAVISNGNALLNAYATTQSELLNTSFAQITGQVDAANAADVEFFDLLAFTRSVYANPVARGFTNVTQPCLNPTTGMLANPTCAGYLYFDPIHPTGEAHRQIGAAILAQVAPVPEPATWAMMMLGFGVAGAALRGRRRLAAAA